jgi:hypothetical protein
MRFISISTVVRVSARLVPILVVRLALDATLPSPQSLVALRAVVDVLAHTVQRPDHAVSNAKNASPFGALPGPGWG